jgi:predicted PurR-regulated permease PerM
METFLFIVLAIIGSGIKNVNSGGDSSVYEYEAYIESINDYVNQLDKQLEALSNQTQASFNEVSESFDDFLSSFDELLKLLGGNQTTEVIEYVQSLQSVINELQTYFDSYKNDNSTRGKRQTANEKCQILIDKVAMLQRELDAENEKVQYATSVLNKMRDDMNKKLLSFSANDIYTWEAQNAFEDLRQKLITIIQGQMAHIRTLENFARIVRNMVADAEKTLKQCIEKFTPPGSLTYVLQFLLMYLLTNKLYFKVKPRLSLLLKISKIRLFQFQLPIRLQL